jgi:hypothetical protein
MLTRRTLLVVSIVAAFIVGMGAATAMAANGILGCLGRYSEGTNQGLVTNFRFGNFNDSEPITIDRVVAYRGGGVLLCDVPGSELPKGGIIEPNGQIWFTLNPDAGICDVTGRSSYRMKIYWSSTGENPLYGLSIWRVWQGNPGQEVSRSQNECIPVW